MQTVIDILKTLIDEKNVSKATIAASLFPENNYPRQAFERVLSGEGKLTFEQIGILSKLANLPITAISTGEGWKAQTEKVGFIHFSKPPFMACLNTSTGLTTVTNGFKFVDEVLTLKSATLSEYIASIENVIQKHKNF